MRRKLLILSSLLVGSSLLNGCGYTAEENHHHDPYHKTYPRSYDTTASKWDWEWPDMKWDKLKKCSTTTSTTSTSSTPTSTSSSRTQNTDLSCVEDDKTVWHTNCSGKSCREVGLTIHYMLGQDLGSAQSVIVEAFNNPQFTGRPVGSTRLTHFSATGPGENRKTVMFLNDGVYYFRAYVANKDDVIMPYEYEGMEVVAERPMGVYGAMSGVTEFIVGPKGTFDNTVNIYIDKLFKKEESAEPTKAFLRVLLSSPADYEVPAHRQVVIELFDKDDFAYEPVKRFVVASENLKVAGREGKTEFLSPELPEGSYYVRAYLDLSDNDFWDEDEPVVVFLKDGRKGKTSIIKNRTETMTLHLATTPTSSDNT